MLTASPKFFSRNSIMMEKTDSALAQRNSFLLWTSLEQFHALFLKYIRIFAVHNRNRMTNVMTTVVAVCYWDVFRCKNLERKYKIREGIKKLNDDAWMYLIKVNRAIQPMWMNQWIAYFWQETPRLSIRVQLCIRERIAEWQHHGKGIVFKSKEAVGKR